MSRKSIGKTFPLPEGNTPRRTPYGASTPQSGPWPQSGRSARASLVVTRSSSILSSAAPAMINPPGSASGRPSARQTKENTLAVHEYLSVHDYPRPVLADGKPPTQSEFKEIFAFIYRTIEPSFHYTSNANPEQDIFSVLRLHHYPQLGQLTSMHMRSVGSLTSWPVVVAMLRWLCDWAQMVSEVETPVLDDGMPWYMCPQDIYDRLLIRYFFTWYQAALAGDDGRHHEIKQALVEDYRHSEAANDAAAAAKEAKAKELIDETARLQQLHQSYLNARQVATSLEVDREKLTKYCDELRHKTDAYPARLDELRAIAQQLSNEIKDAALRKSQLRQDLSARDASPDQVAKLHARKSALQEQLRSARETRERAREDSELEFQRMEEEYAAIDASVHAYNSQCAHLNLEGCSLSINPQILTTGSGSVFTDNRDPESECNFIGAAMNPLRSEVRRYRDSTDATTDQLDRLRAECDSMSRHTSMLQEKANAAQAQLDMEKHKGEEEVRSVAQGRDEKRVEREQLVATMRSRLEAARRRYADAEHRLESQRQALEAEAQTTRDQYMEAVNFITKEVTNHREMAAKMLEDVDEAVKESGPPVPS
ncbi:hypothetical protein DIRU0_D23024 [Diutina rugosa]